MEVGPNKASLLKILTSALANKHAAEVLTNIINDIQNDLQALSAKLDADSGVTDTNYEDITNDNETVT